MSLNFKSVVTYTHPTLGQKTAVHFHKTKASAQTGLDQKRKNIGYPIIGASLEERDANGKWKAK